MNVLPFLITKPLYEFPTRCPAMLYMTLSFAGIAIPCISSVLPNVSQFRVIDNTTCFPAGVKVKVPVTLSNGMVWLTTRWLPALSFFGNT